MVFTPPPTFVVRSREYGNGSEYDQDAEDNVMPDHYVKRLWRQRTTAGPRGKTFKFVNKDSRDRTVLFSATENGASLVVRRGSISEGGQETGSVVWDLGRNIDRSLTTLDNTSGPFKDILKKGGSFASTTQSRIFVGPDGLEYKWKVVLEGSNPIFPEIRYRTLHRKDIKFPLATTARLVRRDGESTDETYPVYIAQDALWLEAWLVTTLVILDSYDAHTA